MIDSVRCSSCGTDPNDYAGLDYYKLEGWVYCPVCRCPDFETFDSQEGCDESDCCDVEGSGMVVEAACDECGEVTEQEVLEGGDNYTWNLECVVCGHNNTVTQ